ncbi:MAG: acylphosphatase [Methanomassiliicoccales archaeon]|nr:acylphosphatase [Methanomassiliicoccales archaeon]
MAARAEVKFVGIVQGVHFRDYTRRFAMQQRVTGWVRNRSDGTVEAVFEGDKHNIEEVVRRLREEHPRARIAKVEVIWGEARNEFSKFSIRS